LEANLKRWTFPENSQRLLFFQEELTLAIRNFMEQRYSTTEILRRWRRPSWWSLLITLPWALVGVLMIWQGQQDLAVSHREKSTDGVFTAHEPSNHNTYVYQFSVEGKPYTGRGNPPNRQPVVGQAVVVYYDPLDPTNNALDHFAEKGLEIVGPVPVVLLATAGVASFIFFQRRRASS
jgi:hypothetical protein